MTFSPTITIEFSGIGTLMAVAFLVYAIGFWHAKIATDRSWFADISKRVHQQCDSPWLYVGEPVLLNRADAAETIFRRNPYRHEGMEPLRWAA